MSELVCELKRDMRQYVDCLHAERHSMSHNFVLLDTNYDWFNWGPLHVFTLSETIVTCQKRWCSDLRLRLACSKSY